MMTGKGKSKYSEENLPSDTLSTTNPIQTALGLNLDLHGKKPESNYRAVA